MTSREKFEAWMTDEQWFHGSDFEWDERRNCYAQFGIHLAYKAFLAAEGAAEQKLTDMAVQLANAESKCRGLAAENAGLKSVIAENWNMRDVLRQLVSARPGGVYFNKWEQVILKSLNETPATDDFLAEVRAQGVEMMAAEADQLMNELGDDSYKVMVTADLQRFANAFAAQLRKGAAL